MIKEIEALKVKANQLGEQAAAIEEELMIGITLPFLKRHELEVEMYSLRLEQSKNNLKYHQILKWAKNQNRARLGRDKNMADPQSFDFNDHADIKSSEKSLREIVSDLELDGMRCNCDLDNWQPEISTGHSWVCRIHKKPTGLIAGMKG